MLDIARSNRSVVALTEYSYRLNADVPSLDRDVKVRTIEASVETVKKQIDFRSVLINNLHLMRYKFAALKRNLQDFEQQFFNPETFAR